MVQEPSRILIVDDDESIRDVVKMTLEFQGYDVDAAEHGGTALETVRVWMPHIILLDMKMPVMDGWEFARLYRQLPNSTARIVVVTAAQDAAAWAAQIGAADHLDKPFDIDDLITVVDRQSARNGSNAT